MLCGGEVCQRCGEIRCCAGPCVVQGAMQAGVQCGGEVWKRYRAGFCAGWCGCCEAVAKSLLKVLCRLLRWRSLAKSC